jgi:hypothetical protein
MRVVKMIAIPGVFDDEAAVDNFFTNVLPNRVPPGLFHINHEIAADGLEPGERLLFTYRGRLRFVGLSATGRQANTFGLQDTYPNCFIVEPASIQPADATLDEVEAALADQGVVVHLASRGWNQTPDSQAVEDAVSVLVGEAA